MPVAIRSAALNDVPAILTIEQQAPNAAHWTAEQYKKLVGSGIVLVAEEAGAGELCGFVCAKAVAGEWEIENVVVAAEFLRRGIANELVSELIQRADDRQEKVRVRLETYERETAPLLDYYQRTRRLHRVDGTQSPEEIYADIERILNNEVVRANPAN